MKKETNIKIRPWDAAEHLKTEEDIVAYLEAAVEDGYPALIVAALDDIARGKRREKKILSTGEA